jgi:hypothetical protein
LRIYFPAQQNQSTASPVASMTDFANYTFFILSEKGQLVSDQNLVAKRGCIQSDESDDLDCDEGG